jgi:hypothetical protein
METIENGTSALKKANQVKYIHNADKKLFKCINSAVMLANQTN